MFLANGLGWPRTSRDFETRSARLKALATTFHPLAAEAGLPGSDRTIETFDTGDKSAYTNKVEKKQKFPLLTQATGL